LIKRRNQHKIDGAIQIASARITAQEACVRLLAEACRKPRSHIARMVASRLHRPHLVRSDFVRQN
jgi:hypothetical protein